MYLDTKIKKKHFTNVAKMKLLDYDKIQWIWEMPELGSELWLVGELIQSSS
jgi:hypothetical protein